MDYNALKMTDEVIQQIPPLSLEKINQILDAYTLQNFSFDKAALPCVLLLLPDDESKSGHYIALAQSDDKKTLYYFDSYGYNPLNLWAEHPQMIGEKQDIDKWGEFLKQYDKVIFNEKKLQNDNSNICGFYCITYIYEFNSRSIDFTPEIFKFFIEQIKKNYDLLSYDNALIIYFSKVVANLNKWYDEAQRGRSVMLDKSSELKAQKGER